MAEQIRWEERYKVGDIPWDTGEPSKELERTIREHGIHPSRAIELGCGTGTNAIWLAQQGFDVTAVDFSSLALEKARQKATESDVRVQFLQADVLNSLAIQEQFPFFFDRGCYHVVRRVSVGKFLETLELICEPGALGLILTGNAKEPHEPGPPVVSEADLRSELGRIFEIVRLREFRFDQAEKVGVRFLGWSCLVRRLALASASG
jgi:2-polyprenyl-3-methyl-5-hydroxy-6-metoxy-1,4-benzoquinol methylase